MAYLKLPEFRPPSDESNPNVWADLAELYCFVLEDKQLTKAQFLDFITDNTNNSVSEAAESMLDELEDSMLTIEAMYDERLLGSDAIEDRLDSRNRVATDRLDSKANEYFDYLNARAKQFGIAYPFLVEGNTLRVIESLTALQKTYIVLLISSQLRMATPSGINKLGHYFESLCEPVFKQLTPSTSETHFFGAGSNSISALFSGTFFKKVQTLCNQLCVDPGSNFTIDNIGKNNVGDGGLDWVGFQPFFDGQSAIPTFFGQCACGANWIEKQYDAHPSKWRNYIQFPTGYLIYHFIPHSFRKVDLQWYNPLDIQEVVLLDRIRLLQLLQQSEQLSSLLNLYDGLFFEIENHRITPFD